MSTDKKQNKKNPHERRIEKHDPELENNVDKEFLKRSIDNPAKEYDRGKTYE